jgi:hypothetical protein
MNQEPSAASGEAEPSSQYARAYVKSQGQAVSVARPKRCEVKRSPLPSARELDAAIERKYGCLPYRE